MAAGAFQIYHEFKRLVGDKIIDLDTDVFKMGLLLSSYTPALDAHTVLADVTANESADTDYVRQTLGTVTWDETNGIITWDAADVSFGTSVDISAKYAFIYDDTPGAPVDPLVCYSDLDTGGGSVSSTNGSFQVTINASGILTLT